MAMVKPNDFLNFIKSRRSAKRLRLSPIPREIVEDILAVATSAPSAHNAQPWRFIVITNQNVKLRLAEAMAQAWQGDLLKDGLSSEEVEKIINTSIERTMNASVLIIVCLTMDDMDKYFDERRKRAEYLMAVQSVSAAIQNLLLAVHAKNLGACWRCAPLFCTDYVREILRVPKSFDPQALIEIGSRTERLKRPTRKPLKDIIRYNGWNLD
ncbi:MAG: nitroreductase family protein [Nitrososphaerales archaeon]|nr:nitroreductase family protein [Nitrososphaerales archaeon]